MDNANIIASDLPRFWSLMSECLPAPGALSASGNSTQQTFMGLLLCSWILGTRRVRSRGAQSWKQVRCGSARV